MEACVDGIEGPIITSVQYATELCLVPKCGALNYLLKGTIFVVLFCDHNLHKSIPHIRIQIVRTRKQKWVRSISQQRREWYVRLVMFKPGTELQVINKVLRVISGNQN